MNKPAELPNCLPIGTRLGEFEIREVIGEGGFGIVYLAFDHSLQRTVAVKEYMPAALAARASDHTVSVRSKRHAEAFGAGLRSFINEARLLAQFDHPALVKVYRFWEAHGTAYMAMRYYEGRTFKAVCRDNPELVNEAWLKRLLQPVLGALEALYAAQILHRDVSPENIMIQPDGQPVLLDFGAARQIVQDMAQSLTVILKPGFAPVEQYADDESMRQGPWTDIYSLSAVMYAAITGKAPPAAVARMLNDPIEPLAIAGRPGYSMQFLDAIDRGMAVRPEVRPQSIAEFAALLGLNEAPAETRGAPAASQPVGASAPHGAAPAPAPAAAPASAPVAAATAAPAAPAAAPAAAAPAAGTKAGKAPGAVPAEAAASASGKPSGSAAPAKGQRAGTGKDSKPGAKPGQRSAKAPAAPPAASGKNKLIGAGIGALLLVAAGAFWFADGSPVAPVVAETASVDEAPASQAAPEASVATAIAAGASAAASEALATPAGASASASASTSTNSAPDAQAVASAPAAPTSGSLTIAVQPWATIYVDGVQKGITPPLKKLTLPLGEHEVRLENPNFPAYVQKVTIDGRKSVTIKHDF
ncbi:protein kinase [Pseudoduganella sp.]|uniref:protein kinase domain-containing protein n=1 Tax=Pseudoduganella sp. TaxID=1880898 RepID=UPI0035B47558